jgi:hypothetical protein
MDVIKAITNWDGRDQCHHCEAPKCSRNEPLNPAEEGRGDKSQSHKGALLTNATKALQERCEYQDNTHTATTITVTGASITATQAQQM